jgi:methyl-accepting chemotaxis protein
MKHQSDQAARALTEQTRAMKDVVAAVSNTSKQIKLIHRANREHTTVAGGLLEQVADVRRVAERNAHGVSETRSSVEDLRNQAIALGSAGDGTQGPPLATTTRRSARPAAPAPSARPSRPATRPSRSGAR